MNTEYTYIIPGEPVNYNQYNQLKQKEWTEQSYQLQTKKLELINQHKDAPLINGILRVHTIFYFEIPKRQKHSHYLTNGSVFNFIRFIQKVAEGTIIAKNANIRLFDSDIRYSHEPRTVLIIEKEIIR